jgi:hypothetical protein
MLFAGAGLLDTAPIVDVVTLVPLVVCLRCRYVGHDGDGEG